VAFLRLWAERSLEWRTDVTDERWSAPGTDTDEIDPNEEPRRPGDRPASDPPPDEGDTNPLLREGPDAPDAADIEDPDEQL
jgi:hypothetical protein